MNILQGIKPSSLKTHNNANKFVIKSRPSINQNKSPEIIEYQTHSTTHLSATDQDVNQFLTYMINRSKKFKEFLDINHVNQGNFVESYVYGSISIKALIKYVMDKMLTDRRLGHHLKGMNRAIMIEIENYIWNSLERQMQIYHNQLQYTQHHSILVNKLMQRKKEIQKKIKDINQKNNNQQQRQEQDKENITVKEKSEKIMIQQQKNEIFIEEVKQEVQLIKENTEILFQNVLNQIKQQ